MPREFTVVIEKGEDGYFISEVVELPGCHTQAKTLDELIIRTKEAIALYLEGEEIDRGLLNKIIKHDLRMTREEFMKYV